MSFKFSVGQTVEFHPAGSKTKSLFKVVRHMPEEFQAFDRKYRIKGLESGAEWNVWECDLEIASQDSYSGSKADRIVGRR